ncbi:MAG: hypothetical protein ACFFE8_12805 [Candidatus Heimdallarchaeota archaeon]
MKIGKSARLLLPILLSGVAVLVIPSSIEITESFYIQSVIYSEFDQEIHYIICYRFSTPQDSTDHLYHVHKSKAGQWSRPKKLDFYLGEFLSLSSNNKGVRLFAGKTFDQAVPANPPLIPNALFSVGTGLYEYVFDRTEEEWKSQLIFDTQSIGVLPTNVSVFGTIYGILLFDNNSLFITWGDLHSDATYLTYLASSDDSVHTYEIGSSWIRAIIPVKETNNQYYVYFDEKEAVDNLSRSTILANFTMKPPEKLSFGFSEFYGWRMKNNYLIALSETNSDLFWNVRDLAAKEIPVTVLPMNFNRTDFAFGPRPDWAVWEDKITDSESIILAKVNLKEKSLDFWQYNIDLGERLLLGSRDLQDSVSHGMDPYLRVIDLGESINAFWRQEVALGEFDAFYAEFNKQNRSLSPVIRLAQLLDFSDAKNPVLLHSWQVRFFDSSIRIVIGWGILTAVVIVYRRNE